MWLRRRTWESAQSKMFSASWKRDSKTYSIGERGQQVGPFLIMIYLTRGHLWIRATSKRSSWRKWSALRSASSLISPSSHSKCNLIGQTWSSSYSSRGSTASNKSQSNIINAPNNRLALLNRELYKLELATLIHLSPRALMATSLVFFAFYTHKSIYSYGDLNNSSYGWPVAH
jgi:hypothetical protein